jgi:mannose-1-phosphate guanylyltransferase/phosphomannomutase
MLATQNTMLSEARASLPEFFTAHTAVRCPWESKGKVMRVLAEESASAAKVEMLDGIKVFESDNSWALVLPDASEPIVHVFAEGKNRDQANNLAHRYALKVTALRG